jgi:microcystin-dependent protein
MSAALPFLGEIYMFAGNFAPRGWALCAGQLLSISQNAALFSLLGTTYGGDGVSTFALPDLRGRIPVHRSGSHVQGAVEGSETVTLTANQMPVHTHQLAASPAISSLDAPATDVVADSTLAGVRVYAAPSAPATMAPGTIGQTGGGQPHENRMPFLAVNFIIAMAGIFPSRN